jgi:trk system potassium uptake protein TrkA
MKFAVIGLGSFGANVAKTLYERGHEVLAIDKDKGKIEEAKSFSSQAVVTDASEMENLEALEVKGMDVVVVSLGSAM